ncbi:hypothetical protein DDB_G0272993 [Dictyostelium discoideum AX4]|uniref:Uncharacterized protein n=1 Tax=Dictyostelium discoideum TaxID=44689 RepID=Q558Z4_DICDI|nr:hypothetical protein DDB_G0272993 [Dictyostelium discoideum AX4]EAL71134.1 hypothetical protein DDB_G0272993 [Dictyostelium discoideum AX4]|eukprot:XP_644922.1 hypothetical protein DDB_G0272993 [Dictyostelium discoideum AX4]
MEKKIKNLLIEKSSLLSQTNLIKKKNNNNNNNNNNNEDIYFKNYLILNNLSAPLTTSNVKNLKSTFNNNRNERFLIFGNDHESKNLFIQEYICGTKLNFNYKEIQESISFSLNSIELWKLLTISTLGDTSIETHYKIKKSTLNDEILFINIFLLGYPDAKSVVTDIPLKNRIIEIYNSVELISNLQYQDYKNYDILIQVERLLYLSSKDSKSLKNKILNCQSENDFQFIKSNISCEIYYCLLYYINSIINNSFLSYFQDCNINYKEIQFLDINSISNHYDFVDKKSLSYSIKLNIEKNYILKSNLSNGFDIDVVNKGFVSGDIDFNILSDPIKTPFLIITYCVELIKDFFNNFPLCQLRSIVFLNCYNQGGDEQKLKYIVEMLDFLQMKPIFEELVVKEQYQPIFEKLVVKEQHQPQQPLLLSCNMFLNNDNLYQKAITTPTTKATTTTLPSDEPPSYYSIHPKNQNGHIELISNHEKNKIHKKYQIEMDIFQEDLIEDELNISIEYTQFGNSNEDSKQQQQQKQEQEQQIDIYQDNESSNYESYENAIPMDEINNYNQAHQQQYQFIDDNYKQKEMLLFNEIENEYIESTIVKPNHEKFLKLFSNNYLINDGIMDYTILEEIYRFRKAPDLIPIETVNKFLVDFGKVQVIETDQPSYVSVLKCLKIIRETNLNKVKEKNDPSVIRIGCILNSKIIESLSNLLPIFHNLCIDNPHFLTTLLQISIIVVKFLVTLSLNIKMNDKVISTLLNGIKVALFLNPSIKFYIPLANVIISLHNPIKCSKKLKNQFKKLKFFEQLLKNLLSDESNNYQINFQILHTLVFLAKIDESYYKVFETNLQIVGDQDELIKEFKKIISKSDSTREDIQNLMKFFNNNNSNGNGFNHRNLTFDEFEKDFNDKQRNFSFDDYQGEDFFYNDYQEKDDVGVEQEQYQYYQDDLFDCNENGWECDYYNEDDNINQEDDFYYDQQFVKCDIGL